MAIQDIEDLVQYEGLSTTITYNEFDEGIIVITWYDGPTQIGLMRLDVGHEDVFFLNLSLAPEWRKRGIFSHLCERLPAFFRGEGIKRFLACAGDENSSAILRSRGFETKNGRLEVSIDDPNNRMDEYATWKAADGSLPKPDWVVENGT